MFLCCRAQFISFTAVDNIANFLNSRANCDSHNRIASLESNHHFLHHSLALFLQLAMKVLSKIVKQPSPSSVKMQKARFPQTCCSMYAKQ